MEVRFEVSEIPFMEESHFSHFNSVIFLNSLQFRQKLFFKYSHGKKSIFISFVCTSEKVWTSLPSSTFGGFEVAGSGDTAKDMIDFVALIEAYFIKNHDIKKIVILLPPALSGYFSPEVQFYSLYSKGYAISTCNLSYSLRVEPIEFEKLISYGNLKRIRKCIKSGVVADVQNLDMLPQIYEVISSNRIDKGYPMTLSIQELNRQVRLFPNRFQLFSVELNGVLMAGAIAIRLNVNSLYILYWGDLIKFRSYSPIVILCKSIYEYCLKNNISFLDVGTSTINREPNFGLMEFKSDLGFSPNLKFTLEKDI